MSVPITIYAIMGLGQNVEDPQNPMLGVRPYLDRICATYAGVFWKARSHAQSGVGEEMLNDPGRVAAYTHSNGSDDLIARIAPAFAEAGRIIEVACVTDPVPEWGHNWALVRWFRTVIFKGYRYPIPAGLGEVMNYWGAMGAPFVDNWASARLAIKHDKFPGDIRPQAWFESRIARLAA